MSSVNFKIKKKSRSKKKKKQTGVDVPGESPAKEGTFCVHTLNGTMQIVDDVVVAPSSLADGPEAAAASTR